MEFSSNPNTKCTENLKSSISKRRFSDLLSQEYLNQQVRTNKLVKSVFYHPSPSRLARGLYCLIILYTP